MTLEDIDNPKINIRKLAYGFMDLSWVTRCSIVKKLNLIDEEDQDKDHVKILDKIIQKAKDNDCLAEFWKEIVASQ